MQISSLNTPVDQIIKPMSQQPRPDAKVETDAKVNQDGPVAAKLGDEELGGTIDALA